MKNAFFVLEIFICLPWLFASVEEWLDKEVKVNFKICDVTAWTRNNDNKHIAQYLKK